MNPTRLLTAVGLGLVAFATLANFALASGQTGGTSPSLATCSLIDINIATGDRVFIIADLAGGSSNIISCTSTQFHLDEVTEGSSVQLTCTENVRGVNPPAAADTNGITLRAFADNTAFPAPVGTGGFWSRTFSTCSPANSFQFYCTSDGTNSGSPRSGPVRLYVSAAKSSVPSYSDDSDQGSQGTDVAAYGVLLCKAKESSITLTPTQTHYAGGQTVTQTLTLASSSFTSINVGQLRVKCGSPWDTHTGMTGPLGSGTSGSIASTILPASWPNGCSSIKLNASITAHSALTGYTSLPYTVFDATSMDTPSNNTQTWSDQGDGTINIGPTDIERPVTGTVSYLGSFDGVNMTKCGSGVPSCGNVSSFTISSDTAYAQPWGLRDSNGAIASGASVTCSQLKPDSTAFATVAMGNTDTHGTGPIQPFTVGPPKGTWSLTCSATWNSNTATYTVSLFFATAYTADTVFGVKWSLTYVPSNATFLVNITGILRAYDPMSDDIIPTLPDAPPKCTVLSFDTTTGRYSRSLLDRVIMTQSAPASATYSCTFWTTRTNLSDDFAFVFANVTGSPFVGQAGYALPTTTDSLSVVGDLTATGAISGTRLNGQYDISQATGMIATTFDPYVQPLVFGGMILVTSIASLWIARERGILGKLAITLLLVIAAIWAASATVTNDASAFRWVAVLVAAGWSLIVIFSMKSQGVRR